MLAARLERGAISISIGDILAFFLTVWAAYVLSAFIRFVLEEDVYPRTRITPGRSYATSSLLHYVSPRRRVRDGNSLIGRGS